jgi:uncharacterized membrane protein
MALTRTRLLTASGLALLAGLITAWFAAWPFALVAGWAVAAANFTGWVWLAIWPMDAASTQTHATREDPSRTATDLLLLAATVVSLIDVGYVLVRASHSNGSARVWLAGLAVMSVALSWLVVHTLFTLRYARVYYGGTPGGIDFNQSDPPCYSDFAYLAMSIGMTYQVSDTDLTTHAMRATALRHALLSFLFGSVILGTTINLIVSLSSASG